MTRIPLSPALQPYGGREPFNYVADNGSPGEAPEVPLIRFPLPGVVAGGILMDAILQAERVVQQRNHPNYQELEARHEAVRTGEIWRPPHEPDLALLRCTPTRQQLACEVTSEHNLVVAGARVISARSRYEGARSTWANVAKKDRYRGIAIYYDSYYDEYVNLQRRRGKLLISDEARPPAPDAEKLRRHAAVFGRLIYSALLRQAYGRNPRKYRRP